MKPLYVSTVKTGKTHGPCLEVRWSKEESNLQCFSISSDGRVTGWSLSKNELAFADVMKLSMTDGADQNDDPEAALLIGLAGGTCFRLLSPVGEYFHCGYPRGSRRRCSKAYNAQYL